MGSETAVRLGAVVVSRTSSFLFFSCENNLIERSGRREPARHRFQTSLVGRLLHAGSAEDDPDLLV
jgi:hypothetical protein